MAWNRKKSDLEALTIQVLRNKNESLSLSEIVSEIEKMDPYAFTGKMPTNSLYSIICRREKRRIKNGNNPLFLIKKDRRYSIYSLNIEC